MPPLVFISPPLYYYNTCIIIPFTAYCINLALLLHKHRKDTNSLLTDSEEIIKDISIV